MNKLLSCEFNIDTACVELRYVDGSGINIYCPSVEDSFDTTLSMRTEMDRLIVCKDGTVCYVGGMSKRNLRNTQLR